MSNDTTKRSSILPLLLMLLLFSAVVGLVYFVVIRPQNVDARESAQLQNSIQQALNHKYGSQLQSFQWSDDYTFPNIEDVQILLSNGQTVNVDYNVNTKQVFTVH